MVCFRHRPKSSAFDPRTQPTSSPFVLTKLLRAHYSYGAPLPKNLILLTQKESTSVPFDIGVRHPSAPSGVSSTFTTAARLFDFRCSSSASVSLTRTSRAHWSSFSRQYFLLPLRESLWIHVLDFPNSSTAFVRIDKLHPHKARRYFPR